MNTKRLQKIVKGFSNHRRIQIMELLETYPDLSLSDIASRTKINLKTAGEHTRRLDASGLIEKNYRGRDVIHSLTILGKNILTFLRKLE
ncbi:winged helix-turn-helix transcriptional regulator [Candidatus Woesebacteria bacterium]|nr:winged helix-turn-helix transcriptional regulator [Candidatus Woesebacteria bacterium]